MLESQDDLPKSSDDILELGDRRPGVPERSLWCLGIHFLLERMFWAVTEDVFLFGVGACVGEYLQVCVCG